SASFSVARCSRPMCGSAFWITSPSISSTRRNTPCAAGCCGPKFIVRLRISATEALLTDNARYQHARFNGYRLVDHALLVFVVAHLDLADEREVLAERMPDEAVVGQDAAQVRMTFEDDTEKVEGL